MRTVKVVMLPAKGAFRGMGISRSTGKLYEFNPVVSGEGQHLYFTSDEEIKEGLKKGDKIICDDRNTIHDAPIYTVQTFSHYYNGWILTNESGEDQGFNPAWTSSIVATTDPAFTKTSCKHCKGDKRCYITEFNYRQCLHCAHEEIIPVIPESFILKYIEMFNAGTPITSVQLEEECAMSDKEWFEYCDLVAMSFPSSKQHSRIFELKKHLNSKGERTKKLKLRSDNTVIVHPIKERTFTKAELEDAYDSAIVMMADGPEEPFYKWFERKYASL